MLHRRSLLAASAAALSSLPLARARAAGALPPGVPIIIVGFAAGGIGDALARLVAEAARARRNTQVIVENRPGGGGSVATDRVARMAPDGLNIVLGSPGALLVLPHQIQLGYDPVAGLTPLGQLVSQPLPIYVRADSPLRDWAGALAFARANPGQFSWGTAGARSFAEIVVEAALRQEGLDTTSVPFRGGGEAIQALLGGHVMAVASTDYGPLLQQGAVRLLVETGPIPVPGQPLVPTFQALGYPLCFPVGYGFLGPAGMPAAARDWWESLLAEIAGTPAPRDFAQRYLGVAAYEDGAGYGRIIREGFAAIGDALRKG